MDITDKTWEEVFVLLAQRGELGKLIVVACIFAFLGWLITWLYFTKIRFYKLENELSITKENLASKQADLDNAQKQLQEVQKRYNDLAFIRDRINVENATKPDEPDVALSGFYK